MLKSCVLWFPVMVMLAIDLAFAISNILLKKIVNEGMDHLVFITYRQSISALFLAPLAYFLERRSRPKLTSTILCHLFLSAIIGASLTQYLFLLGLEFTSATFSCAFLNMVPVVTFLMALPFGLETLNIRHRSGVAKLVGAVVCLGGAVLLTLYKGMPLVNKSMEQLQRNSSFGSERWAVGSVALFAGTFLWSSWFLLQSNIAKKYPCQYSTTAIMTCFSAIQSAILCLSIDRRKFSSCWALTTSDIFIIIYAGMVGSGLCFVGMSWCVKKKGPVFTAAFSPLVQIMAATIDVPVLHEQLHLGSLIGSVTVMMGLYILLWGKDKEIQIRDTQLGQQTEGLKEPEAQFQVLKLIYVETERAPQA
ncbi:WAT1-related protein At3g30340-like isoform X1 [Primulina huaijiensis]|uniref:WAT1-related protein At3g30340-like isoform X1 n=1 Tax=Primulina huaijiensis TaxID=1492673 RepID=UPI003CC70410